MTHDIFSTIRLFKGAQCVKITAGAIGSMFSLDFRQQARRKPEAVLPVQGDSETEHDLTLFVESAVWRIECLRLGLVIATSQDDNAEGGRLLFGRLRTLLDRTVTSATIYGCALDCSIEFGDKRLTVFCVVTDGFGGMNYSVYGPASFYNVNCDSQVTEFPRGR